MKRAAAALIALTLILAACSRPAPTAQPPARTTPTAQPPAHPGTAQAGEAPPQAAQGADPQPVGEGNCLTPPAGTSQLPFGRLEMGAVVTDGICAGVGAAEGFVVSFALPGGLTEDAARSALKVEGGAVARSDFVASPGRSGLWVAVAAGEPGTTVTVRLDGPVGPNGAPADLGFAVQRVASPTASAEVQIGDGPWQPVIPGATLPRQSLRLRVRFSRPVNRNSAENRVNEAFAPGKDAVTALPYTYRWEGEESLLIDLPAPPPRVSLDLTGVTDEQRLPIRQFSVNLFTGEPPRLVALDPVTGRDENLGEAPVDIWSTTASPDGRWAILSALDPISGYSRTLWLVESASGQLRKTDLSESLYGDYFWFPDHLLVPFSRQLQVWDLKSHTESLYPSEAEYFVSLSPDRRFIAGFSLDWRREDPETFLAPITIVVHDLVTHEDRVFTDVGNGQVRHSEAPPYVQMAWSEKGDHLHFQDRIKADDPGQRVEERWMALDLASGQVTPAPYVSPSPQTVPAPVKNSLGWQYVDHGWGAVRLTSPQGQEREYGHGKIVGWRADGRLLVVRWANYPHLRTPGI